MGIRENIKALRKQHQLSQQEFAKIAGVSDKAISTWEQGSRVPRMGAIQKIADYFGLKKSDIIEEHSKLSACDTEALPHGSVPCAPEPDSDVSDTELLVNAKRDLSPEDYALVIRLIKRLRNQQQETDRQNH